MPGKPAEVFWKSVPTELAAKCMKAIKAEDYVGAKILAEAAGFTISSEALKDAFQKPVPKADEPSRPMPGGLGEGGCSQGGCSQGGCSQGGCSQGGGGQGASRGRGMGPGFYYYTRAIL